MRIAWVLPDGERQRRFDKFQKAPVHNKFSQFVPDSERQIVVATPFVKEPTVKMTFEEMNLIKSIKDKFGGPSNK